MGVLCIVALGLVLADIDDGVRESKKEATDYATARAKTKLEQADQMEFVSHVHSKEGLKREALESVMYTVGPETSVSSFAETEESTEAGGHGKSAKRYKNFTEKMERNETMELDGLSDMVRAMDKMAANATRGLDRFDEEGERERHDRASGEEFHSTYWASFVEPDVQAGAQQTLEEMSSIDAMMTKMHSVQKKVDRGLVTAGMKDEDSSLVQEPDANTKVPDGAQQTLDEMNGIDAMVTKMNKLSSKAHRDLSRDASGKNPYIAGEISETMDQLSALETAKKSSLVEDDSDFSAASEMAMLKQMITPEALASLKQQAKDTTLDTMDGINDMMATMKSSSTTAAAAAAAGNETVAVLASPERMHQREEGQRADYEAQRAGDNAALVQARKAA